MGLLPLPMRGATDAVPRALGPGELPGAYAKNRVVYRVFQALSKQVLPRRRGSGGLRRPEATSSENEVMHWRGCFGTVATDTGMSTETPASRVIRWRAVPRNKKNKEASAIATTAPRDPVRRMVEMPTAVSINKRSTTDVSIPRRAGGFRI